MNEQSPAKQLLDFLYPYGIGNYKIINDLLLNCFPENQDHLDFNLWIPSGQIKLFLEDMLMYEFVKYYLVLPGEKDAKYSISAAIQPKGIDYLLQINKSTSSVIHISGDNNQVVSHSSSSKNLRSEVTNPYKLTANIINPTRPSKKSFWVIVISIITIISGIVTIQIGWFPNLFKSNYQSKDYSDSITVAQKNDLDSNAFKPDSVAKRPEIVKKNSTPKKYDNSNETNQEVNYPRHFSQIDLKRITDIKPLNEANIVLTFNSGNAETQNFAEEIYRNLNGKCRSFQMFSPGISPIVKNPKFDVLERIDGTIDILIKTSNK